ncbi:DUF357 domain-containing protein, partial [Candidatus Pacearchaeota archaeon]|nr:DUF357 domain-containing protein [Candidatus Pacearchaeota archaeon]
MKDNKKINIICDRRLDKYFSITEKALKIAKKSINKERKKEAEELLNMAELYYKDAHHFRKQGHYVNAFAAINYAHGWIDSASRLGLIKVKDS